MNDMNQETADIGLIGLAVMGQNLALNMNDQGFTVVVYNRTADATEEFLSGNARGSAILGAYSIAELVSKLKRPRRVMLMIKAGQPVDEVITQILPHLEAGDILIDGGNSNYQDTTRRTEALEAQGFLFVGSGVSGGEEGARHGPSLMPGGSPAAWPHIKEIFQAIAAKVADGTPCCDWVGEDGAGHFVKMVHNGIEYGDMQLIGEAYDLMRSLLGLTPAEMSRIFADWNRGKLDSYLIQITAEILAVQAEDGAPMIDKILDSAGQKGTGKWTAVAALEQGIPLTLIGEAVFARFLSTLKDERVAATAVLPGPAPALFIGDKNAFLDDLREALYAAKIISYTQGYMLFRAASQAYGWHLNYGGIALMWREGCIIRAAFLDNIQAAYGENPQLTNLLLAPYFKEQVLSAQAAWRRVVATAELITLTGWKS